MRRTLAGTLVAGFCMAFLTAGGAMAGNAPPQSFLQALYAFP